MYDWPEHNPGLPLAFAFGLARFELPLLIEMLGEKEQIVINERFGLLDNIPKYLVKVFELTGLSEDVPDKVGRILAIEVKAMSKLRARALHILEVRSGMELSCDNSCWHLEFERVSKELDAEFTARSEKRIKDMFGDDLFEDETLISRRKSNTET